MKAQVQQTRGLTRNANRTLKGIFKGAATTVIGQAKDEPLYRHYLLLLDGGTKPNLAKLTVARQVASIMLAVWRNKEVYDPARVGQAASPPAAPWPDPAWRCAGPGASTRFP